MNTLSNTRENFINTTRKAFRSFRRRDIAARIDRNIVHKYKDENVFIGDVRKTAENTFECEMVFDDEHKFFFEHRIDHVPGLLMLEAARQMGTAICHLFYDVDYNYSFIIDFSNISFKNFTELNKKITVRTVIEADVRKKNRKIFSGKSFVIQDDVVIAEVESTWRCLHKKLWDKLRAHKGE
ncbi:MAG: hypothetical protein COB30_020595 [Ectothiorhodospiraceae bacterium]|nr:hypothetical protein [Ectothiorhodospiraceae bacterium]